MTWPSIFALSCPASRIRMRTKTCPFRVRKLLEGVLNSGTGRFSSLVVKIAERSITHRKRNNPVTRGEIAQLNDLVARVGFKIPELRSGEFLDRLPREGRSKASARTAYRLSRAGVAPASSAWTGWIWRRFCPAAWISWT